MLNYLRDPSLEQAIREKKTAIKTLLEQPMLELTRSVSKTWDSRERTDEILQLFLGQNPGLGCSMMYFLDKQGRQCSSNVYRLGMDSNSYHQDLSERPYLDLFKETLPEKGTIYLTQVYIDKASRKPCITAISPVFEKNAVIGYLAADVDLNSMAYKESSKARRIESWRQIKGDPSIRKGLFGQTRTLSAMDKNLDQVINIVESLVIEQGIFHAKLHFSSSRATLWPYHSPYHYQVHVLDEIINPEICLAYPRCNYPEAAVIRPEEVREILALMKWLREDDDIIYLRAGSLNVINGVVGLNFSCDGTHYLPYDDFIHKFPAQWSAGTLEVK